MKKVHGQPEPAVGQRWRAAFRGTVRELIRFEHNNAVEWAVLYSPSVCPSAKVRRIEAWKLGFHPWRWRIYDPEGDERRKTQEKRAHVGSWWQSHGQVAQIVALFRDDKGTLRAVMDWGDDVPQTYPEVAALTVDHGWTETEPQPFELAGPRFRL